MKYFNAVNTNILQTLKSLFLYKNHIFLIEIEFSLYIKIDHIHITNSTWDKIDEDKNMRYDRDYIL